MRLSVILDMKENMKYYICNGLLAALENDT